MEVIALAVIAAAVIWFEVWAFQKLVPRGLEYSCCFSASEAHEGEDLFLVETLYNRKLLPVPWLKADIHSSRWLDFAGANSVITQDDRRVTSIFYLGSYKRITRRWRLKCLKRGVFTIENTTLVWGDILDLGVDSKAVNIGAKLTVFPEVINLEETFIPANYLQGDTLVKRWVVDDPFMVSGAREYANGDPLNRIHWRATAREGKLMVRKNDFTSQLSLTILLNIQSIEYELNEVVDRDAAELGIKVAASLVDRALRMGSPVRFGTNGQTLKEEKAVFTDEASGREHAVEILGMLAAVRLRSVKNFDDFMEDIYFRINSNDVIIITAYLNEQICNYARRLIRQSNIVKVILLNRFVNSADIPGDLDVYILPEGEKRNEG